MHIKTVLVVSLLSLLIYSAIPVIFRYSKPIQRNLVFMNWSKSGFNLSTPEQAELRCTRTLRLVNSADNKQHVELGVWHTVAKASVETCLSVARHKNSDLINKTLVNGFDAFASDTRPIVLYVHGNRGDRGTDHRINLYKRISNEFDMHLVSFDYRGFGDSTDLTPSATGLVSDTTTVFEWLLKQNGVTKDRIRVWGHSLGTGVASAFVSGLSTSLQPSRLLLEAPFDSLGNAIANHPFAKPFKWMSYFDYYFVEPIQQSEELNFDSTRALENINKKTHVMIVHAADDKIIPMELGYNLYSKARKLLGESKTSFIGINADQKLGHKFIYLHNNTMDCVQKFFEMAEIKLECQEIEVNKQI